MCTRDRSSLTLMTSLTPYVLHTNNLLKGGNNSLNQSPGCSNPTIYKFIETLQLYNYEAEIKLLQLMSRQGKKEIRR